MEFLIILTILILFIFSAWPKYGLYILAFSLPFIGIEFEILNFSIPIVDAIALLLFISFLINYFGQKNKPKLKWPIIYPFLIFLSLSFISVLLSDNFNDSLYNFLRWPFFLYFAYLFTGANIISNAKILKNTIISVALSSILVLLTGYLSLLSQDIFYSFFRLQGIMILNHFPFGDNHNLIAEYLNVGTFLILITREFLKTKKSRNMADILFVFSLLGLLLTFSRSAWITLALQLLVYFLYKAYYKKRERVAIFLLFLLSLIILLPVFYRMNILQDENVGSTKSRILLNEITISAWQEKPFFGHGNGQFINLVDKSVRFKAQHGEAIDAHGFLQKIITENGTFGLVAYLFIIIYLIKITILALNRYYPKIAWLLPLALAVWGGLFFQFFNTSYYKGKVWLPILLLYLAIKFLDEKYVKKNKSATPIT